MRGATRATVQARRGTISSFDVLSNSVQLRLGILARRLLLWIFLHSGASFGDVPVRPVWLHVWQLTQRRPGESSA
eukprot:12287928-Karenia_brevis.AAC.1